MKDKKYKYVEDMIDDYLQLLDEQIEIPLLMEKANKKFSQRLSGQNENVYSPEEAEDLFKFHSQIKKFEERKTDMNEELAEVENSLKEFLTSLKSGKISYEKKDDNDKSKMTYLFWLQDDKVMCNR